MTAQAPPSRFTNAAGAHLRPLVDADAPAWELLMAGDEDAYCVLREKLFGFPLGSLLPGRLTGYFVDDALQAAVYSGANLIPVHTEQFGGEFARELGRSPRSCSAIVGYAKDVLPLWDELRRYWGSAREVRDNQPVMLLDGQPIVSSDPSVRLARIDELDAVLPAAVNMFIEEVGVSPVAHGRGPAYRARLARAIEQDRVYVRMAGDRVVFKAEVGATSGESVQVQGVWLDPALRGQGLAVPAMAATVEQIQQQHGRRVSLYANHYNLPALNTYRSVGFRQIGTFATVHF